MDPSQLDGVSVIVGALAAGAGDGLKDVTKGAVTGAAYSVGQGLQAARDKLAGLLKSRFHGNEDATADLTSIFGVRRPRMLSPLLDTSSKPALTTTNRFDRRPPAARCGWTDRDRTGIDRRREH